MKTIIVIALVLICELCFAQNNPNTKTFETRCDSIYENKGYKIIQLHFLESIDTITKNTVFQLTKTTASKQQVIYQDTIYSQTGEIEFRDFNNDGIKDILIQNISDARSNWTYYLYLVDTVHDKLTRIKGFDEIKNPNYLSKYNLIDNYVNSGKNWTNFCKIQSDSIKEFGITIYDDLSGNGSYTKEYKKALQTILKNERGGN